MDHFINQFGSLANRGMNTLREMKNKPRQKQDEIDTDNQAGVQLQTNNQPSTEYPDENLEDQPTASNNLVSSNKTGANKRMPASVYHKQSGGFGGDSELLLSPQPPPPIGFKSSFLPVLVSATANPPQSMPSDDKNRELVPALPQLDQEASSRQRAMKRHAQLEGGLWSRTLFQRMLVLTVLRLCLFIKKIFEDWESSKTYREKNIWSSYLLSLASIILPTLIFTIYRIGRYMQTVVFVPLDVIDNSSTSAALGSTIHKKRSTSTQQIDRQAIGTSTNLNEDEDGLVTARQSPLNEASSPSPAPTLPATSISDIKSSAFMPLSNQDSQLQSVSVENLGEIPDKETVGLFMGAMAQLVHGVLFVFWQLKRQVDLISFLVARVCIYRPPYPLETKEMSGMSCFADGLEFFEDFYAGFLGTLIQVSQMTFGMKITSPNESDIKISEVHQDTSSSNFLIKSELIVSILVIWSLLIAVRRRDDGPLTFVLSTIGWGSIFASRIIIIVMSVIYFRYWIILMLAIHVLGISSWIYHIAIRSHNGLDNEERIWIRSPEEEEETTQGGDTIDINKNGSQEKDAKNEVKPTDNWSLLQHSTLITQIVALFGLPSLFYWPFMFNLKMAYRPFIYMTIILAENFLLILVLYFGFSNEIKSDPTYLYYLAGVAGASIAGFVFLTCYIGCKPKLTDHFARFDVVVNEAETSGIYYEFCSRVFRLPDVSHPDFRRLTDQQEVQEAVIDC